MGGAAEDVLLILAADEFRQPAARGFFQPRAQRPEANHLEHPDLFVDSLDVSWSQRAEREIALDQIARGVADHDRACIGEGLDARGEIHGVADGRIFGLAFSGPDLPHHDLAGVHAGPDLDWSAPLDTLAVGEAANFLLQPQRRIERALGVIFVRHRRAEQCKDAVAGRLYDVAVITAHGVDHHGEHRVDQGAGLFRIEVLLEPGRVDDVDEEGRDELAFAFRHEALLDRGADRDP